MSSSWPLRLLLVTAAVRCGAVRRGAVRRAAVRRGAVRRGAVRRGAVRRGGGHGVEACTRATRVRKGLCAAECETRRDPRLLGRLRGPAQRARAGQTVRMSAGGRSSDVTSHWL
eukprot:5155887-Prymnesium_polylepis.1